MKKLFVILLLALFTVGISSCAEEPIETDPLVPEINTEVLKDKKSGTAKRHVRKSARPQMGG